MVVEYVLSVLTVFLMTGILYFKWVFSYWKRRNIYTLPTVIPFGNAKKLLLGQQSVTFVVVELYKEVKAKGLKYGGYYLSTLKMFVPVDLQLIQNILIKDFQYFTDRQLYINEEADLLTGHLLMQQGAKWKALRTKLTPTFSSGKLKMMFQTLVDCTQDLPTVIDRAIEASEPIDIKETFARYTTDVIGSTAFGIDCHCLKNPDTEFRKYGRKIFEKFSARRIMSVIAPRLMAALNISLADKSVEKFFINLVKETAEFRDKNNIRRNDFMQLLLDLRHTTLTVESKCSNNQASDHCSFYQDGLSLNEIIAQVFVFYAAGFETSSSTLTFLMYEIVNNTEIQEKLRAEIREVLDKHKGKITYDGLSEMTYLDKCIHETLRKYPPAGSLPRVCTKAYRVPGSELIIEKDTPLWIPIHAIHHDPEFYPEPEKFDPERFSEENKQKRPSCSYIPFGEGPRICIGLRFGVLQTKVGLIALLRNHRFRLNPKTKTPLTFAPHTLVLAVKGGVWLDVERID